MSLRKPSHVMMIIVGFAASLMACLFLFPDLFFWRNQSFLWHHDTEIPFQNIFALVNHISHGGVGLFDRYDGMNFAYAHLTSGVYTLANVLTALVFYVCSPFMDRPGEAFHHFFSIGFHAITLAIRTIGGYLLLNKFRLHPMVNVISLVIFNTLLSSTMYFGYSTENLYSYFPLLAYFIISFFDSGRLRDAACAVVVMTIAVANSPLFALSYFYQVVHFLIVCALVMFLWNTVRGQMAWPPRNREWTWGHTLVTAGICALILLPSILLAQSLTHDFYIASSGLGGTEGRVQNMFHPMKYFGPNKHETITPLGEFPFKAIDFTNTWWEKSWVFMGASVVLLSLLGWVCAKSQAKHLFAGTIILTLLANTPLDPKAFTSLSHWINALTNPFSFLIRSYHMSALLMPFVFLPLVGLGLQALWEALHQHSDVTRFKRIPWVMATALGLGIAGAFYLPFAHKQYALAMILLFIAGCFLAWNPLLPHRRRYVFFAALLFFGLEAGMLKAYYDNNQYHGQYFTANDGRHLKPRVFSGFEDTRELLLEYQNPFILPVREFVRTAKSDTTPDMHSYQNHYGLFFHYAPLERYLRAPDIYTPWPLVYQGMEENNRLRAYLAADERQIVLAKGATPDGEHQRLPPVVKQFVFDVKQARVRSMGQWQEYALTLPKDFPSWEATALFTEDRRRFNLRAGESSLLPVQGAIVSPHSFDVNNIKQGYVIFSWGLGEAVPPTATLTLLQSGDMLDVWRNTSDDLGFTFLAASDGWLVMHQPYDAKWRVSVDGQTVNVKKVNTYFMGVPLNAGEHKILMRYWPNAPLRWLIPLSLLATMAAFAYAIRTGLKEV